MVSTPFYKDAGRQIVFTDLEPDDCLAISIMNKERVTAWVVGEGRCLPEKATRLEELVGDECVEVYLGRESNKEFAETHKATHEFELFNLRRLLDVDTVVMLKPPRELMQYFCTRPRDAKEMYGKLTLIYYGSFNTRCLFDDGFTHDEVLAFLSSFKAAYIFESYLAVQQDSIITDKDAIEHIRQLPHMAEIMDDWDAFIVQDCQDTCMGIDVQFPASIAPYHPEYARYMRNRKCYDYIMGIGVGKQMVLADIGLMLTGPEDYMTASIKFTPEGYLQATKSLVSSIHVVKPTSMYEMLARLRAAI